MLFRWLSDVFPVGNWCGKDKYERFPMFFLVFSEQNICKKMTNGAKIQKKSYIFAAVKFYF